MTGPVAASLLAGAAFAGLIDAAWSSGLLARAATVVVKGIHSWRSERRRKAAFRQWPQALLYVAGAVSAGSTVEEALAGLAREAPEPLRSQVARAAGALSLDVAIARAMDDPELRFARAALILHTRSGGRVGRVLENTAAVLQERVESEARLRALTAQGRASAWIAALTPLALGAALAVLAPDLAAPLIHSTAGRCVLGAAALLVSVGLALSLRLARVET